MKNTKAEKQLKAEKTIDLILRYIKENNLQPGDRLPSERAFSDGPLCAKRRGYSAC